VSQEVPRPFCRASGLRGEDADFGVPPDREQHPILAGGTNNHYGATTISPADLGRLLAEQMFRQLETCLKDGHGTSLN
jgi:hypothetical protein